MWSKKRRRQERQQQQQTAAGQGNQSEATSTQSKQTRKEVVGLGLVSTDEKVEIPGFGGGGGDPPPTKTKVAEEEEDKKTPVTQKPVPPKKEHRPEPRAPSKDKLLTLINMSKAQPSLDIKKLAEAVNVKVDPTTIELLKNLNMQLILAAAASKQGEKQTESNVAAQLMDMLTSKSSDKTERNSHSTESLAASSKVGSSKSATMNSLQQSVSAIFGKTINSAGNSETKISFPSSDKETPTTTDVHKENPDERQRSLSNPGFESQVSYDSNQSEQSERYEAIDKDRTDGDDNLYNQSNSGMWKPPTPDGPPPDSPEFGSGMTHEADFSLATPGVKAALMQMLQGQPSGLGEDVSFSPSRPLSNRGLGSAQTFADNLHDSSSRERSLPEHDSSYRQRNYGYDSDRGNRPPDLSSFSRDRGPVMAMSDRGPVMDGNSGYGRMPSRGPIGARQYGRGRSLGAGPGTGWR